jgi:predicted TIM-barrel fold metal-dependent hydrolase
MRFAAVSLVFWWFAAAGAIAQVVDPEIERLVNSIPAIDNHAHPNRCAREGEPPDDEADQISLESLGEFPLPPGLDPSGPFVAEAWQALYGLAPGSDEAAALAAKQRAQREHGDGYAAWILDRIGIETMLANRIALGRCLAPPRFAFVPFVDPLIFPLDNAALHRESRDTSASVAGVEHLLRRYQAAAGLAKLPADLAAYVQRFLVPTLARLRSEGAVAVKFEANYIRPVAFERVGEAEAARVYEKYVRGGSPPPAEYRRLQDHLFAVVAREAGRLGLPVHVHALGIGAGPQYDGARWDPWRFESVLNDPALFGAQFVLVHGGWPQTEDVAALLMMKANLYADISAMTFTLTPRGLANVLRSWLALAPNKVLFGTDTFAMTPAVGWEELAWSETRTARRALALALSDMLRDGEIDRARAEPLARAVMRENARRLYGFGESGRASSH